MRTLAFILFLISPAALAQTAPQNMDFESGSIGQPPPGWTVTPFPATANVSARLDGDHPQSGRASASLTVTDKSDDVAGAISQNIDAAPYRGKFVLFRAAVHAADSPSEVYLRIRAEGPREIFYPNNEVDADPGGDWKFYQTVDFIPPDAEKVDFALIQIGKGTSGIDSASLQTVDPSQVGYETPRPLSPRGLMNLHAYARLFGYVRFFHPSDEAAKADWHNIAIAGVQRVESAPNSQALIAALRAIFMPLAPTLRIYATGDTPPPASPALSDPPAGATIIGWQHHGVHGDGDDDKRRNSFYTSKRVAMTAPLPDHPFAADLGGGVCVLMPTTLYKDDKGTLPHIANEPAAIRPDKPALFVPSGLDRATRLADVVLSWTLFRNFYPYFAEEPVDMPAVLDAALSKAATDRDEYDFQHTLEKEVAALRDGHGQVMFETQRLFILPVYWEWIENRYVVALVTPQSGALKPGDVIDSINGRSIDDLIAEQLPLVSASTRQGAMGKLSWLIRQTRSSAPVRVEAHRGNEKIVADIVPKPAANFSYPLKDVTELKPGIWYIDLRKLKKADLDASMAKLAQTRAVIFDMRGYPSPDGLLAMAHLSDAPIHTQHFDIPITTQPDQIGVTYDDVGWAWQPRKPRFKGKMLFLTNGTAQSQAEMFMSFVEDNHLGTIIGSTTAGVDGEINYMNLPGDYTLSWTGTRAFKYDGSRFMGVGVTPSVLIKPTIAGIRAGRDEVLEKAIEIAGK
jgi:hypothetical protein